MNTRLQILVAINGSDASMEAVHYLSRFSVLSDEKIVLFHVYSPLPDFYWNMEGYTDPKLYREDFIEAMTNYQASRTVMQERLEKAKNILIHTGFSRNRIEIKLSQRQIGDARDIIEEAHNGYDLAVVGRKGSNNLAPYAFGSVTVKIMQRLDFIPLVLVGTSPPPGKALIALDGSSSADRVLDTLGPVLVNSNLDISLLHVIRADSQMDYLKTAERRGEEILASAERQLVTDKVEKKLVSGKKSRAAAIMDEATRNDVGTIVVGRKGLSNVECFYMGRVSYKIAQLADKHAVWIGN